MNAIEINGLRKKYKDFRLEVESLELPEGYVGALVGRNGAGKTTLIKAILELVRRDSGEIRLLGLALPARSLEARAQVGFVPETLCLHETVTPRTMGRIVSRFFASWDGKRYDELLARLDIQADKKIKQLSKGQKMKCQVALALSHGARLLVMDEPAAGLDPIARREILAIMREELEREGLSILVSSHITSDLDRIADYFFVMDEGRVALSGTKVELAERYCLVKGGPAEAAVLERPDSAAGVRVLGIEKGTHGFAALVDGRREARRLLGESVVYENPGLEDVLALGAARRDA
ncbi:MAG: ABC transporter ATP-binding protein [Spirochaetaceae bacterium]|nr:ABC transporter ATP-binding protein [Spirochaetaceae bacterium]